MKKITFNTGRKYSVLGQRIGAIELDSGWIVFADLDRGLEYVISPDQAELTEKSIMNAYETSPLDSVYVLPLDMQEIRNVVNEAQSLALKAPTLSFI